MSEELGDGKAIEKRIRLLQILIAGFAQGGSSTKYRKVIEICRNSEGHAF